jgi:glucose/mannose-6-phosphate isomerase
VNPRGYLDTAGLWEATAALPEQINAAWGATRASRVDGAPPDPSTVRSVALFGLGPDAIAASAAAAVAAAHSPAPVWVGSGPGVPAFVDEHTLVVVVSTTGDAVETLAAAWDAVARRAQVVVVTGGDAGALSAPAEEGLPRVAADATGPAAARAATGATAVSVLAVLSQVGLVPDLAPSVAAAATMLARRRDDFLRAGGPADAVARRIGRTIPLVYGSDGAAGVAAARWKASVNLNAKAPALWGALPGLAHDELAGWGQGGDVTRQIVSLVLLRHDGEDARTRRLFEAVVRATDEVMADVLEVRSEGADELGRFLDLALFGDFVSLYLAGPEGVDPGPTPAVADAAAAAGRDEESA